MIYLIIRNVIFLLEINTTIQFWLAPVHRMFGVPVRLLAFRAIIVLLIIFIAINNVILFRCAHWLGHAGSHSATKRKSDDYLHCLPFWSRAFYYINKNININNDVNK